MFNTCAVRHRTTLLWLTIGLADFWSYGHVSSGARRCRALVLTTSKQYRSTKGKVHKQNVNCTKKAAWSHEITGGSHAG